MKNNVKIQDDTQSLQSCVSVSVTDLRIGNLIFSKETQEVQKITGVTEEHPFFNAITFDYPSYDEIEAIIITEEWLLKLGFTCDWSKIFTKQIEGNAFELRFDKTDKIIVLDVNINYEETSLEFKHIKFVHQLQNLYYALTGLELQRVDLTEH